MIGPEKGRTAQNAQPSSDIDYEQNLVVGIGTMLIHAGKWVGNRLRLTEPASTDAAPKTAATGAPDADHYDVAGEAEDPWFEGVAQEALIGVVALADLVAKPVKWVASWPEVQGATSCIVKPAKTAGRKLSTAYNKFKNEQPRPR